MDAHTSGSGPGPPGAPVPMNRAQLASACDTVMSSPFNLKTANNAANNAENNAANNAADTAFSPLISQWF
ncbi:hypothetical protein N7495_006373 [Penicillium taxi]|uniref:uncharacterized protein n=1 Tax=Penicillium taxi TaxID=168475 RepID=UPI002544D349|nr:uncharacterized protein N7495_006373 [Penicillium taxi]KAJ5894682.1 hypothetical protein N7495_006373 [Penicillium taxi]